MARPAEMLPEGGDEVLDKTEAIVSKLLFHMGLQAQVSAHYGEPREDRRPIMVDVRGSDLGILIGRRGQTLDAFQYVSALMVGKQTGQFIQLVVDVEGHRDRREQQLRQLAQRMAEQVLKTGRKLTLEPMRASERRIIHMELRDHPAVMTESVGEEPYRKVTIIPRIPTQGGACVWAGEGDRPRSCSAWMPSALERIAATASNWSACPDRNSR